MKMPTNNQFIMFAVAFIAAFFGIDKMDWFSSGADVVGVDLSPTSLRTIISSILGVVLTKYAPNWLPFLDPILNPKPSPLIPPLPGPVNPDGPINQAKAEAFEAQYKADQAFWSTAYGIGYNAGIEAGRKEVVEKLTGLKV